MGIAPTGKPIDVRSVNVDQIADGLIVARWSLIEMMSLLTQIAALPRSTGPVDRGRRDHPSRRWTARAHLRPPRLRAVGEVGHQVVKLGTPNDRRNQHQTEPFCRSGRPMCLVHGGVGGADE